MSFCVRLIFTLTALALAVRAEEPGKPQRYQFVQPGMGTVWQLIFHTTDDAKARAARDAAWARLAALEAELSDYREDSALNKLCRARVLQPAPPDLMAILQRSVEIGRQTGGAFDPTVGPMVRLWRASKKSRSLPDKKAILDSLSVIGWRKIHCNPEAAKITLDTAGMQLDLGGIAKGYAQDEILKLLAEKFDLKNALIDAGGGVASNGPPPDAPGWTVALDGGITLSIHHAAVATSGDAHQFVEIGGNRYSHIVDPDTGLGLTSRIQATVIAPDSTTADALATACCVMGLEKAKAFSRSLTGIEIRLTPTPDPDAPEKPAAESWETPGFAKWKAAAK